MFYDIQKLGLSHVRINPIRGKRMLQKQMRRALIFFMIGALIVLSMPPTTAAGANCDAAFLKCMLAYTAIFGLVGATTLCTAGYVWCRQFLN